MLVFQTLTGVEYVYQLVEKTKITMIAVIFAAIENIVLNIIMIPFWGLLGAAVATFITYMSYTVGYFWFSRRYLKFQIDIGFVAKSLIAAAVMGVVIFTVNPSGVVGLLCRISLGVVIYVVSILLLKGFDRKEIKLLRGFLRKS
jgi:O-antigen/teichoic acid export membrane protein